MKTSKVRSWSDWFDRAAQEFTDPRMKIAYYKNGQTGEPYSEDAVRATHEDIFQKLSPAPDDTVLDVGCGVGYFTHFFGDKVKQVTGTDVSPHMIETAKQLNPEGSFAVAPADSLPFQGNQFNKIFSYGVTQYLPDEETVRRMLSEMLRLLKDGGRILIGDILEPVHQKDKASYNKVSTKGKAWWPESLDHDLTKLYLTRNFFEKFAAENNLKCTFHEQKITGRTIPTPRYDVILDAK